MYKIGKRKCNKIVFENRTIHRKFTFLSMFACYQNMARHRKLSQWTKIISTPVVVIEQRFLERKKNKA